MSEVTPRVEDGTEFRNATIRVREGGLQEALAAMGPDGFFRVCDVRVSLQGTELYLEFTSNIKTEEKHVALPLSVWFSVADLKIPEVKNDGSLAEVDSGEDRVVSHGGSPG